MSEHDAIQLRRRTKANYSEFRADVDDLYRRWQDGHVDTLDFHARLERLMQKFDGTDRVSCLCGLALLRTIEGQTTQYYTYRLASAGPLSKPVWRCPQCGMMLDIGTTKLIDSKDKEK